MPGRDAARPQAENLRGLSVWLGAALLGSVIGTVILNLVFDDGWPPSDWGAFSGVAGVTLIFTVGGSALLGLAYPWARRRHGPLTAYARLVILGVVVGGGPFLVLGGGPLAPVGAGYAALTGIAWCALHRLLFRD